MPQLRLHWQIEDFWGQVRLSGEWTSPPGYAERAVDASKLGRGWFRASVSYEAGGTAKRNESLFCVLPPPGRSGDPPQALRRIGLMETLQREFRVIVAGPTTLAALLNSLQMGFRTLANRLSFR